MDDDSVVGDNEIESRDKFVNDGVSRVDGYNEGGDDVDSINDSLEYDNDIERRDELVNDGVNEVICRDESNDDRLDQDAVDGSVISAPYSNCDIK